MKRWRRGSEDASKVLLAGHTIGRLAQERDRLTTRVAELERSKDLLAGDLRHANHYWKETKAQRDDFRAAYNRVASAARAVTAELQKVGDEAGWQDGDETDRVYAWHELLPLVKALDADIHQSRLQSETTA